MVGGGLVTEFWGWRWIFLLNVPVVVAMLLLARRVLVESRAELDRRPLDVVGGVAVTVGLVLVIVALTAAPRYGWLSAPTGVPGLLGLGALAGFVAVERRHRAPLVPPSLVGRLTVLAPNGAVTLASMVGVAWLYLLTLYFQEVRGEDASTTGLLFAPMTVASLVGAAVAGRLAVRVGTRRTAATGLVLVAAGLVAMAVAVGGRTGGFGAVLTGMVVGETGFMLGSVALTIAATGSLGDRDSGLAAGLLNTSSQLGGGVGLGVVAAVVAAAGAGVTGTALRHGFLACLVFSVLALVLILSGVRPGPSYDRADRI
jgi:MFS family permease